MLGYISLLPLYYHPPGQVVDELAILGELALSPACNIIKLPNVSASIPQLVEAIAELQGKGYDLPEFVQVPTTDEEKSNHERYSRVLAETAAAERTAAEHHGELEAAASRHSRSPDRLVGDRLAERPASVAIPTTASASAIPARRVGQRRMTR